VTRPHVSHETLTAQVARVIRNEIHAGMWRDGEVLPSTRKLAERIGTSTYTVNHAMQLLAEENLVVNRARSNRVVNYPQGQPRERIRPDVPRAVLIGGFAGSGKTELGRILARLTGWPILDKDTLTRPVVETALEVLGLSPHDRESADYLTRIRPREYEALMAAALENVDCGNSALITAPFIREFSDPAWVSRTRAQFETRKVEVSLVWIYCDADSMQTYIRQRGAARDAAKLADWPAYLGAIDLNLRPPVPHHLVDNSVSAEPLQTQAQSLARTLLADTH